MLSSHAPVNTLHYLRYLFGADNARSQTTEAERALLGHLAVGRKVIVELGVFEGVSSLVLRDAMDRDAELYCVDPFPVGALGFSVQMAISKKQINRSRNGRAHMVRMQSNEAVGGWTLPIDLLFMDGDHSFEGACRDFRDWGCFVRTGGLILVHTSHSSDVKSVPDNCGPKRLVEEVVAFDKSFRVDRYVDSITVVEKLR
jgi:predicted O-methyltransferase YrrM